MIVNIISITARAKMPHFSLFGDTVNVAARMEQSSAPSKIHYHGNDTQVAILRKHFIVTDRDALKVKGKEGMLRTYWIDGPRESHAPSLLTKSKLLKRQQTSLIGLQNRDSTPPPSSSSPPPPPQATTSSKSSGMFHTLLQDANTWLHAGRGELNSDRAV